jgi:hypothetical protein
MISAKAFSWISTLLVLTAIVIGVVLNGSPETLRMKRQDSRRIDDLRNISRTIDSYYSKHAELPATLDKILSDPETNWYPPLDPQTLQLYQYTIKGPTDYALCTTFALSATTRTDSSDDDFPGVVGFLPHGAGRQCFDFSAGPRKRF